ncbi:hypothetical protein ACWDSF_33170 [Nocardia beijingensis]
MKKKETRRNFRGEEPRVIQKRESRTGRVKNWVLSPNRIRGLRFVRDAAVMGLVLSGHHEIAAAVRMGWTVLSILFGPYARGCYRAAWKLVARVARALADRSRRLVKAIRSGAHAVLGTLQKAGRRMRDKAIGRR